MAQTLVQSDKLKVSCCLPLLFFEENNMIPHYNYWDHILGLSLYYLVVELTGDLKSSWTWLHFLNFHHRKLPNRWDVELQHAIRWFNCLGNKNYQRCNYPYSFLYLQSWMWVILFLFFQRMNRESWFADSYNRCLENFLQAFVPQIINRLKDQPQIAKVSAIISLLWG